MKGMPKSAISKSSPIVALSVLLLGLQISTGAPINLVNFNDWTPSAYQNPSEIILPVVTSFNSASFGPEGQVPGGLFLTGSIATIPGTTYEIFFTMLNGGTYFGDPTMSFGTFSAPCDLTAGESLDDGGYHFIPQNYDLFVVAEAPITTMTFFVPIDSGVSQEIWLSDVSVTAAPEPSASLLFGFGAYVSVLVHRRLRSNC